MALRNGRIKQGFDTSSVTVHSNGSHAPLNSTTPQFSKGQRKRLRRSYPYIIETAERLLTLADPESQSHIGDSKEITRLAARSYLRAARAARDGQMKLTGYTRKELKSALIHMIEDAPAKAVAREELKLAIHQFIHDYDTLDTGAKAALVKKIRAGTAREEKTVAPPMSDEMRARVIREIRKAAKAQPTATIQSSLTSMRMDPEVRQRLIEKIEEPVRGSKISLMRGEILSFAKELSGTPEGRPIAKFLETVVNAESVRLAGLAASPERIARESAIHAFLKADDPHEAIKVAIEFNLPMDGVSDNGKQKKLDVWTILSSAREKGGSEAAIAVAETGIRISVEQGKDMLAAQLIEAKRILSFKTLANRREGGDSSATGNSVVSQTRPRTDGDLGTLHRPAEAVLTDA